jgi:hypothetical protein
MKSILRGVQVMRYFRWVGLDNACRTGRVVSCAR